MHIVYVCREYPPASRLGGIGAYLKEVAEAFVRAGDLVTVVSASDDTSKEYEEVINGVRVIRLKGGDFVVPSHENTLMGLRKFRMIYRFYSYRRRVRDAVKKLDDVTVIEVPEYGAEAYYLLNLGIPITMRLHTATFLDRDTQGKRKFHVKWAHEHWVANKEFKLMPKISNVTSCSSSLLAWTQKFVPKLVGSAHTIHNPVNIAEWERDSEKTYREYSVVYAGTIMEAKGVGDLVEACIKLRASGYPVTLTLAGKIGSYGENLKRYCDERGLDWILFVGHVSRSELKTLYSTHKVACFPSWWEALAMVCLEAMSIGNVVIGSRNGGMSEVITEGEDGFLITPKDPSILAESIEKVFKMTGDEVGKMSQKASEKIKSHFSTDVIINQLRRHYIEISKR